LRRLGSPFSSFTDSILLTATQLVRLSELTSYLSSSCAPLVPSRVSTKPISAAHLLSPSFPLGRPKSSSTTHAFSSALSAYLDFLTDDLQSTHSLVALSDFSSPFDELQRQQTKAASRTAVVGPVELQQRWRAIKDVVQALAELAGVVSRLPLLLPSSSCPSIR
jgi:hypothetical protein